ncbi:MAG: hypothetical protein KJN62_04530 [Deltaproteobacteria bacterium]|nr:hypothetical protein [Deltaproteobacteria bacterium]
MLKKGYAANYPNCVVYADCAADILGVRYLKKNYKNAHGGSSITYDRLVVGVAHLNWMRRWGERGMQKRGKTILTGKKMITAYVRKPW